MMNDFCLFIIFKIVILGVLPTSHYKVGIDFTNEIRIFMLYFEKYVKTIC